ncbi:MAG: GNAT family N-acetyltransferase [Candidatus Sedimenticola sp. (ex Thyasira tokunagai)]
MLSLNVATQVDIVQLREIFLSAFAEDETYRPNCIDDGSPPGLDTIEKHEEWLNLKTYLKCSMNGELVGSCILQMDGENGVIIGLFVRQQYMNSGIGSWIIDKIQRMFHHISIWTLETPDYAIRNHYFYKKNGFILMQITQEEPSLGFGFHKYMKETNNVIEADAKGCSDE